MEKEKRNYHKESGYKAQRKYAEKSDLMQMHISIHQPQYNRLKLLADASSLSMSKFITEIIKEKYPEVFND